MKFTATAIFVFSLSLSLSAQSIRSSPIDLSAITRMRNTFQYSATVSGHTNYEVDLGNPYIDTSFHIGSILLYHSNSTFKNIEFRYNAYIDELEIKQKGDVRILDGNKVKRFWLLDTDKLDSTSFLNIKELEGNYIKRSGFFQELVMGNYPLFKFIQTQLIKANYNVQLNVGSKTDKIVQSILFYTILNGEVCKLPTAPKKFIQLFDTEDKREKVKNFIRNNNLDMKDEKHLQRLFESINLYF